MNLAILESLSPQQARDLLPRFVSSYVDTDPQTRAEVEATVQGVLAQASDAQMTRLLAAFGAVGADHRVYAADPTARRISRAYMRLVTRGSEVTGVQALGDLQGRQLWVGNHLSYVDTQVLDALLSQEQERLGAARTLADDVLVVAGPKVYGHPFRRVAALSLNTLHTAQSSAVASEGAKLSPREVAAIALRSMKQAAQWQQERGPVLLYPEGTRSRSGHMGSFIRAVSRYLRKADWIVPVAVGRSDGLFDMNERMNPQPVSLRFGQPIATADLPRSKTAGLEAAWTALSELTEPPHQPKPGTEALV